MNTWTNTRKKKQRCIQKGKRPSEVTTDYNTNKTLPKKLTGLETEPENLIEINQLEEHDKTVTRNENKKTVNTTTNEWIRKLTEPTDRYISDTETDKPTEQKDKPSSYSETNSIIDPTDSTKNSTRATKTHTVINTDSEKNNPLTCNITNKWKTIPENIFAIHTTVSETHLTKVYGIDIHKKTIQERHELIIYVKHLKLQVITTAKELLKTRMQNVAFKNGLKYYTENKVEHFVRKYLDIKKSYASDIRTENLTKIFDVCYGNFDLDPGWVYDIEREIMLQHKLKYHQGDNNTTYEPKTGRPTKRSLIQCINIAKNELVKGIIYYGSRIHGYEIRVKHTKQRPPGIFSKDFLVRKPIVDCKKFETILIDNEHIQSKSPINIINNTVNLCNVVKSPTKAKYYETISNLRNKIIKLQSENQKLKKDLLAAETIINRDKQDCLPKNAKEMQTNLKSLHKKTNDKNIKNKETTSPTLSFFSSSSDNTRIRNFKERCRKNRKRNQLFEQEFAIQKKQKMDVDKNKVNVCKKKKVRKNRYTECPTLSPLSCVSSKITLDELQDMSCNDTIPIEKIEGENENISTRKSLMKDINNGKDKVDKIDNNTTRNSPMNKTYHGKASVDKIVNNTNADEKDKEYIVEKIVAHKKIKGRYSFQVKWKNYKDTSWETKSYLDTFICDDVNTYLQSINQKSNKQEKKTTKIMKPDTEINDYSEDLVLCNNQPLSCLHEAICLRIEDNTAYCSKGNILHNVRCADCNNIFLKLTPQNCAHICTNLGRGCDYALCNTCYIKNLVPTRRRRNILAIDI